MHCFDEICTELQLSEKKLAEKMKNAYGNVRIIHR
jgi:nitrogen permease regulator 2-like protein